MGHFLCLDVVKRKIYFMVTARMKRWLVLFFLSLQVKFIYDSPDFVTLKI